jgi:hypothetical protein
LAFFNEAGNLSTIIVPDFLNPFDIRRLFGNRHGEPDTFMENFIEPLQYLSPYDTVQQAA